MHLDESLKEVIESGQAHLMLKSTDPFSCLPDEEIEAVAKELSMAKYAKGTVLFVQGRSRVGHLYILQKGAAQRYYESSSEKTMVGFLGEGDTYGGISMLLNGGIAVRSLEMMETSYFYLLKQDRFLELCGRHELFCDFFTDTFGKRMLDRSYAAIIAKTMHLEMGALRFLNMPVSAICNRRVLFGSHRMTIQAAAQAMQSAKSSFIFIRDDRGETIGILTERDLTRKVIAPGYDIHRTVADVMSAPLLKMPDHALVVEAFMAMLEKDVRHLAVEDNTGQVAAVVSQREFIVAQGHSHLLLNREISHAVRIEDIVACHRQIPYLVRALITSGANAKNVNRFLTVVTDVTTKKIVELSIERLGPPPLAFAFMVMGSEGRSELTLKTDQDNAIIYMDGDIKNAESVHQYFLKLGETVTAMLDQAGYDYCIGGIMARNPKWCRPLSAWKGYFSQWIHAAEPQDLLEASIFFDFRWAFGDVGLVEQLRSHLFDALKEWRGFLRYLTENALHFKPPIGFFRNFVVESKGKHRNNLDIKSAMTPIVDFARVYALKHKIAATNTLERLLLLRRQKVLSPGEYDELEKGYSFLMQLRFVRQVTAILDEKVRPDNYINPKKLTHIEQTMLKEIFRRIEKFQAKMNFDFIGIA